MCGFDRACSSAVDDQFCSPHQSIDCRSECWTSCTGAWPGGVEYRGPSQVQLGNCLAYSSGIEFKPDSYRYESYRISYGHNDEQHGSGCEGARNIINRTLLDGFHLSLLLRR